MLPQRALSVDWSGDQRWSRTILTVRIVYYAPREEKTWTFHSSGKLPPEPKARVAIYPSYGLANFIPVVRILFFAIPEPKTPHSRFGAGRECDTFGQGAAKMYIYIYCIYRYTFLTVRIARGQRWR